MPRLMIAVAIACLLLIPVVASATSPLLDPVTTYTNGMPLASSTPLRSHNAYYQCEPERVGCCGGRYNLPCVNSLLRPNDCCTGARSAYPDASAFEKVAAGVDPVRFEQLGSIPDRQQLGQPNGAPRPRGLPLGLPIGR